MQCMGAAMGSCAAASGARSYLAAKGYAWMTPARMRRTTIGLVAAALLASSVFASGSSSAPASAHAAHAAHATSAVAAQAPARPAL